MRMKKMNYGFWECSFKGIVFYVKNTNQAIEIAWRMSGGRV